MIRVTFLQTRNYGFTWSLIDYAYIPMSIFVDLVEGNGYVVTYTDNYAATVYMPN